MKIGIFAGMIVMRSGMIIRPPGMIVLPYYVIIKICECLVRYFETFSH
jgi:hypothetical protein